MRTLRFFALVSIFLAVGIVCSTLTAKDIHQEGINQQSNYVVIGAFARQRNAVNFTSYAQGKQYDAHFEMNPNRNLYYVYVLDTEDRSRAISEAVRLRENTEFSDAWVYGGLLGTTLVGEDIHPLTDRPMENVRSSDSSLLPADNHNEAGLVTEQPETPVVAKEEKEEDNEIQGAKFLFRLFRADDNAPVAGDISVIDTDRSRKMATYKGNEAVRVVSPKNNSGNVSLICEVFGYRKLQRELNYNNPEGEGIITDDDGNTVVPFELVRLQKGDIAVMYNVYFFKDAGVMRPESRFEVETLVAMLNENPKYKIKLHGHTNGNAPGKIISMGPSKNFFSLSDTKEGVGSAKKLSLERAEVIRDYLFSEGIDHKRIHVKAWGGKRPVHDKMSTRAQENVRVEVEILDN